MLDSYLQTASLKFSPELCIVRVHATFQYELKSGSLISDALKGIDLELLEQCRLEISKRQPAAPEVKEEVVDGSAAERTEAATSDCCASCATPGSKRRRVKAPAKLRLDFLASPVGQVTAMLGVPLKNSFFKLPDAVRDSPGLIKEIMREYLEIVNGLEVIFKGVDLGETNLVMFMKAVVCIFACGLQWEPELPSTTEVRHSRKAIVLVAKLEGPLGELGKCMSTFPGCKSLMAAAREHAAGGIQDDNASSMYEEAVARFESKLGGAFDNLEEWMSVGNDGAQHTIDSFDDTLAATKAMAVDATHAISQWSSAAIQRRLPDLVDFLSIGNEVIRLGMQVLIFSARDSLAISINKMPQDLAPGGMSAGGQGQPLGTHVVVKQESVVDDSRPIVSGCSGGEADVAPNSSSNVGSFEAVANEADSFLASAWSAVDRMTSVTDAIEQVFNAVLTRGGAKFSNRVEQRLQPSSVQLDFKLITDRLLSMATYIRDCCMLGKSMPPSQRPDFEDITTDSEWFLGLGSFCKLHEDERRRLGLQRHLPQGDVHEVLFRCVQSFATTTAATMYTIHAEASVEKWVCSIMQGAVEINVVSPEVADNCELSEVVPMLLAEPMWESVLPASKPDAADADDFGNILDGKDYNQSWRLLETFATELGMTELHIPCAHKGMGTAEKVLLPFDEAALLLKLHCAQRDAVVAAACLQRDFVSIAPQELTSPSPKRFDSDGFASKMLAFFQNTMGRIYTLATSEPSARLEQRGSKLPISIAMVRSWQVVMCTFGRRLNDLLLQVFERQLAAAVEEGRRCTPAWEVVFESGTYDEVLAHRLLTNKMSAIVEGHNKIHHILHGMNKAAKLLDVVPKLMDHEITMGTSKVAMNTLERMSTSVVVLQGIDLLRQWGNHPQGSNLAAAFMKKHSGIVAKIPRPFWEQFESLAAFAPTTLASPASKRSLGVNADVASPKASATPQSDSKSAKKMKTEICAGITSNASSASASSTTCPPGDRVADTPPSATSKFRRLRRD